MSKVTKLMRSQATTPRVQHRNSRLLLRNLQDRLLPFFFFLSRKAKWENSKSNGDETRTPEESEGFRVHNHIKY